MSLPEAEQSDTEADPKSDERKTQRVLLHMRLIMETPACAALDTAAAESFPMFHVLSGMPAPAAPAFFIDRRAALAMAA